MSNRIVFCCWGFLWIAIASTSHADETLPGTKPLDPPTQIVQVQLKQVTDYFQRRISAARAIRDEKWQVDTTSPAAYQASIALHRTNLRRMLGLIDTSENTSARLTNIADESDCRIDRVAIPLADGLAARGLLFTPWQKGAKPADVVAWFLMRCLFIMFTMFAEDVEVGGFSAGDFTKFLQARRGKLDTFVPMLESLWKTMDTGGFSVVLEGTLKQFNGGLFEDHQALPLTEDQFELLVESAEAHWSHVEPAIFGTLLERALDPVERHKLGAHYTPRAYVERLVMPTIIEPLREEWDTVYATAVALSEEGKQTAARKTVRQFHEQLCETHILDPACGSGNFLYVSLELMKRLEGEVLKALRDFGEQQLPLLTIDPHQFLGIEVNPRAAAIADLVLWIGYLQWHFRTRGNDPLNEPIIRKFHNIDCRDAVRG